MFDKHKKFIDDIYILPQKRRHNLLSFIYIFFRETNNHHHHSVVDMKASQLIDRFSSFYVFLSIPHWE